MNQRIKDHISRLKTQGKLKTEVHKELHLLHVGLQSEIDKTLKKVKKVNA